MSANSKWNLDKLGRKIVKKNWVPDDSYKLTLTQIRSQLTPSGIYRNELATTGRAERELRRLEWRWERRLDKWVKAATTVKAGYRGMMGRNHFKQIKHVLEVVQAQRLAKRAAIDVFRSGDKDGTLEILAQVQEMNGDLFVIQAKVLYTQHRFEESLKASTSASGNSSSGSSDHPTILKNL
jgi:hypothetical protein